MLKSQQFEALWCLLVAAMLTGSTTSAVAQSNSDSPRMLGFTARQMLSAQPVSKPDFIIRAPYVGIGVGRASADPDTSQVPGLRVSKGEGLGAQLTMGMDFGEWLSGELHATDLGEAKLSDGSTVSYQEFGFSALMYLGENRDRFNRRGWNVYGRAGLGYLTNDVKDSSGYRQEEGGQWILGAGAEFSTRGGFGVRAEGLLYDTDFNYLQLGLIYRFAKLPGGVSGIADLGVTSTAQTETDAANSEEQTAETGAMDAQIALTEEDQNEIALSEAAQAEAAQAEIALAEAAQAEIERAQAARDAIAQAEAERAASALAQENEAALPRAGGNIVLDGVIDGLKFQPESAELTNAARRVLDDVVVSLKDLPQSTKARINTHTDASGTEAGNMRLSQQRVLAIARYLVQQGIPKSRLEARAFGDRRPIDTNETAAGRFNNGRVEIFLLP